MRKYIIAAIAVATLTVPAVAADLPRQPVKAAPAQLQFTCGTTRTCIGPYAGVNFSGLNANFTSFLPGASGSVGGGDVTVGVHGGFEYWNGTYFAAIEAAARYSAAQNLTALGGINNDRFTFFQTVKLGANLAGVFGIPQAGAQASPSASGPIASNGFAVPSTLMNMLTSAYIQFGAAERFSKTGSFGGAGIQLLLASNWTADVDYKHISWNSASAGPRLTLDNEDVISAGLSYHFSAGGGGFLGM